MDTSPLYYHEDLDAYECLGCGETVEVPRRALLKVDGVVKRVAVRGHAENLLLWRELHALDHADCGKFGDEFRSKDHREHRGGKR